MSNSDQHQRLIKTEHTVIQQKGLAPPPGIPSEIKKEISLTPPRRIPPPTTEKTKKEKKSWQTLWQIM